MRVRQLTALVLLFACSSLHPIQQSGIEKANIAASRERKETAYNAYEKALQNKNITQEHRVSILFEMGLLRQEQAEESTSAVKEHYLADAIRRYEEALALSSDDGGTLNNLARAYAAVNDPRAEEVFKRLVARDGDRYHSVYLFNYGAFLESHGQKAEAAVMRKRAADADTGDAESQMEILRLYVPRGSSEAMAYLKQVLDKGQAASVYDYIVDAVHLTGLTADDRERFLIMMTASLARQSYDPGAFLSSNRGKRLLELQSDENLSAAIGELVSLHHEPRLTQDAFPWWASAANPARRQVFGKLATRIATWYIQHRNLERAGEYLNLAIDVLGADPAVVQTLAQVYAAEHRPDQLAALARKSETRLASANAEDVYAVRREIGMSEANLGQWGDGSVPSSALYQLSRATEIALRFNARNRSGGIDERLPIDAALLGAVEIGWRNAGASSRAVEARLAAARDLLDDRSVADATEVVRPLQDRELTTAFIMDDSNRQKFADIIRDLGISNDLASRQWPATTELLTVVSPMGSSTEITVADNTMTNSTRHHRIRTYSHETGE
jgi:tetratricopeptide (TPR) repeat protein